MLKLIPKRKLSAVESVISHGIGWVIVALLVSLTVSALAAVIVSCWRFILS